MSVSMAAGHDSGEAAPQQVQSETSDSHGEDVAAGADGPSASAGDGGTDRGADTHPPGNEYGFGEPLDVDDQGEVAAYEPREDAGMLRVPITVTNRTAERYDYGVEVLVTGANGFAAAATLQTDVTGVHPGSTWPEEIAVHDDSHPLPEKFSVEITSVSRCLMEMPNP